MEPLPARESTSSIHEAIVMGVEGSTVRLRLAGGVDRSERKARVAIAGYRPSEGDRVVVAIGVHDAFVIGTLCSAHATTIATTIATATGASASIEGESIVLCTSNGEVVARWSGEELRVSAGQSVRIQSGESIALDADGDISLRAGGALRAEATEMHHVTKHWELHAESLVERLRDGFRHVEQLLETRAGRLHTVVRETIDIVGRATSIRSKQDTSVDGRRVLLG